MTADTLLSVTGLKKNYGQHAALNDVAFELRSGEVHCLVGENGAGKSTLIKILSGAVRPDSGSISVLGTLRSSLTPRESISLGISTIYQDSELIESLTVADNIFLGDERSAAIPFMVDSRAQEARAEELVRLLHLDLDVRSLVEELSSAQKQTLQIVKALYRDARILIMDEPTSSLGHEETRSLMDLVRTLKEKGIGIIYISHYLEEVFEIGDTVTVLKDGKDMGTYPLASMSVDELIRKMVGREASLFFKRERVALGPVRFECRKMRREGVVDDVSFDLRTGEIFGIGGLVGSGRTELVSLIYGALDKDGGSIGIDGEDVEISSPRDAVRAGICLITEDRKKFAMLGSRNVVENIVLVHNEYHGRPVVDFKDERLKADGIIDRLSIAAADRYGQTIADLSGGNQQKAIIGRWLLGDAKIFIFDEPTKGVDIGAKAEIYALMVDLVRSGKSVIMVSSDMPELLSMSDRIGVMRNGRMIKILDDRGMKEEELLKLFIGVDATGRLQ